MRTQAMFRTHPRGKEDSALIKCIEACFDCAQACTTCADACLSENEIEPLRRCIRLTLDCADSCTATARMLSRQLETDPELIGPQLNACLEACRICAEECEKHAPKMEHCMICGTSCREAEESCRSLGLVPA